MNKRIHKTHKVGIEFFPNRLYSNKTIFLEIFQHQRLSSEKGVGWGGWGKRNYIGKFKSERVHSYAV